MAKLNRGSPFAGPRIEPDPSYGESWYLQNEMTARVYQERGIIRSIEQGEEVSSKPLDPVAFPRKKTVEYVLARSVFPELLYAPNMDIEETDDCIVLSPPIDYRSKTWKRLHNALARAFGYESITELGPTEYIDRCGWVIERR